MSAAAPSGGGGAGSALPPPRVPEGGGARLVESLREDLAAAGYTSEGSAELLGPVASGALGREQVLAARRVVETDRSPLATLLALFCLGFTVPERRVAAALPRTGLDGARRLGLVHGTGEEVSGICDLRPYGDDAGGAWWVASDLGAAVRPGALPLDHVLGIGGASTTLASWTPRAQVGRVLDLGTGCGVQSLHLSQHADEVVATDISRRALAYAAFNAALAGVDWDLRLGSLLEPVAGERFDLVVSNPPFVITPRAEGVPRYEYRDGGLAGDAVVASLVRSVGAHLEPGGVAQLLGNWETRSGEGWTERAGGWLDGTGLDAWVVQRDVQDPAEYAELWARDGGHRPGTAPHDALVAAWLDDFAARDVAQIGFGVITLRRPVDDRSPVLDLTEASGPVGSPMGPSVLAGLAVRDWLARHDDDAVLDAAWTCAPDVTEERHGRPGQEPSVILARQGGGLGRAVRLDTLDAALLSVCDGELSARSALVAISALLDLPTDAALAQGAALLRRLAADGLVTSPDVGDEGRERVRRR